MVLNLILIEAVFEGPGSGTKQQYLLEILLIVFGAFLLGYLFRFFLNSNMRQKLSDAEEALDKAQAELTAAGVEAHRAQLEAKDEKIRQLNRDLSNARADLVKSNQQAAQKSNQVTKKDQLVKIEGVGPKIAQMLAEGGLNSFEKIANSSAEDIRKVLLQAGPNYAVHDPTTWPEQAQMCVEEKWDELKTFQLNLKGGRKRR